MMQILCRRESDSKERSPARRDRARCEILKSAAQPTANSAERILIANSPDDARCD